MHECFYSKKGFIGKGVAQVARYNGYGHISGQVACDPETGNPIHGSMKEQAACVMQSLKGIMEDMGLSLSHIIKCNVYISSMDLFDEMNAVYISYFGTENPPARQTVVAEVWDKLDIEISAEFYYE